LLGDPALLILDEPMNGLDPAGILDMRRLIRSFVDEGRTVFLSSHLLDEAPRVVLAGGFNAAAVNRVLVGAGIAVSRLEPARVTLEQRFLDLTTRLEAAS